MQTMTKTLAALALAAAVASVGAQPPSGGSVPPGVKTPVPKKSALEEALDLALKNNPDLRVAASKLALAEAELSRTRLQITQKVAAAYADVETARAVLNYTERQTARIRELHKRGAVDEAQVSKAVVQLGESKAKFAAAERELDHLQGKGGRVEKSAGAPLGVIYRRQPQHGVTSTMIGNDSAIILSDWLLELPNVKTSGSDKLRAALQKPVTLSGQKMTLTDFLALVKKTGGIGIQADTKGAAWKETVDFDFKDVTVGGMLQFLEDSLPDHRIVVRHYGLLIAPTIKVPEGAVTLTAFLHAEPAKPAAEKKPVPPTVRPR